MTIDSVVTRSPDLLAAEVDGELVLMSVALGKYFGLDAIGTDIWRRMENPVRVSDLCASLVADYDGEPAAIESDALSLLGQLAGNGLIVVRR